MKKLNYRTQNEYLSLIWFYKSKCEEINATYVSTAYKTVHDKANRKAFSWKCANFSSLCESSDSASFSTKKVPILNQGIFSREKGGKRYNYYLLSSVKDGSRWSMRRWIVPEPEQEGSKRIAFTYPCKEVWRNKEDVQKFFVRHCHQEVLFFFIHDIIL